MSFRYVTFQKMKVSNCFSKAARAFSRNSLPQSFQFKEHLLPNFFARQILPDIILKNKEPKIKKVSYNGFMG